jgi:hypothetical protein
MEQYRTSYGVLTFLSLWAPQLELLDSGCYIAHISICNSPHLAKADLTH